MNPTTRAKRPLRAHCLVAITLACGAGVATAGTASFTGIGDLAGGDFFSIASAVSGDGSTVVGRSKSSDTDDNSFEAFRWTANEGIVGLGDFDEPTPHSGALDVSADGTTIVGHGTGGIGGAPFRWTAQGGMVALEDPTGELVGGSAMAVSADGSVIAGLGSSLFESQAFRWTAATGMVPLGWLPAEFNDSFAAGVSGDGAILCGQSMSGAFNVEPIRWTSATGMVGLGDVPGGLFYALGLGISGDGSLIVGEARTDFGNDEMFLWSESTGFILPDPLHGASFGSSARAASANGSIVVGVGEGGAMIWDATHGMRNVQALLITEFGLDLDGWTLLGAFDVSADGSTIVGYGINPAGQTEGWVAQLPVPTTDVAALEASTEIALVRRGPNPFTTEMAVELQLPGDSTTPVRAAVYGADGRLIRSLSPTRNGLGGAALISWDGRDERGRPTPSGIYFLRVDTHSARLTQSITRLR